MLSHQARKHPEKRTAAKMLTAEQYASQTVDGMRCCIHCGKTFTRVEGLKKHLRRKCRPKPAKPDTQEQGSPAREATTGVVA